MSSTTSGSPTGPLLPDYVPVPPSALGPALNDQGYYVGRVERNLFWVTDGTYQSAFLATNEGIVLFDAPPTIGHNLRRAVDEIAETEGVGNTVTHLVYSHHHADHAGAADLFGNDLVRIGHEDARRLLLRDNDPTRPAPEVMCPQLVIATPHLIGEHLTSSIRRCRLMASGSQRATRQTIWEHPRGGRAGEAHCPSSRPPECLRFASSLPMPAGGVRPRESVLSSDSRWPSAEEISRGLAAGRFDPLDRTKSRSRTFHGLPRGEWQRREIEIPSARRRPRSVPAGAAPQARKARAVPSTPRSCRTKARGQVVASADLRVVGS